MMSRRIKFLLSTLVAAHLLAACGSNSGNGGGSSPVPAAPPAPSGSPAPSMGAIPAPAAPATLGVDASSLRMVFGNYQELVITASGNLDLPLTWTSSSTETLAPGLSLKSLDSNRALIYGTPQFTGEWCSLVVVTDAKSASVAQEICTFADANPHLIYPRVDSATLPNPVAGQYYSQPIIIDTPNDARGVTVNQYDGTLPAGLELSMDAQVLISGTTNLAGGTRFSLVLTDDQNRTSYQQFSLQVDAQTATVSCPAGYYFDSTLLYCVSTQVSCAEGTYLETSTKSCVAYPSPPPAVFCAGDQYFDPYLSVCVEKGFPRCPLNFHWDRFYNRCIYNGLECPEGFAPNFATNTCYAIWIQSCEERSHWDSYAKKCIANSQHCEPGSFWDIGHGRCETSDVSSSCSVGSHWDPAQSRCQLNEVRCEIGFVRQGDRCIPAGPPPHPCSSNQHWDGGHCNSNVKPEPQPGPKPTPRPQPSPRPQPHPQPKPTPRPHLEKLPTQSPETPTPEKGETIVKTAQLACGSRASQPRA